MTTLTPVKKAETPTTTGIPASQPPVIGGNFGLAPLAELPAGSRARLTETLRVWLAEQGRLGQVAARLGVHPQTARYRLARLRELFGEALDDPDERFWLELSLRVAD